PAQVEPARGGVQGLLPRQPAGEPVQEVVLQEQQLLRAGEHLRLLPPQPQGLGQGQGAGQLRQPCGPVERRAVKGAGQELRLGPGAAGPPDQEGPQGLPIPAHGDQRLPLGGEAQGGGPPDRSHVQRLPHPGGGRLQVVLGPGLHPAVFRPQAVLPHAACQQGQLRREQARLHRRGAHVQRGDAGPAGGGGNGPAHQAFPSLPKTRMWCMVSRLTASVMTGISSNAPVDWLKWLLAARAAARLLWVKMFTLEMPLATQARKSSSDRPLPPWSTRGVGQAAAIRTRQSKFSTGVWVYTPWAVPMATARASHPLSPAK